MKKAIVLLLLIIAGMQVFAQSSVYDDYKKWSYGLSVSGTTNYRILTSNGSEDVLKDQKAQEARRISFSGTLMANYSITEVISINSGLSYDDIGFKNKPQILNYSDGTSVEANTAFHFNYITLPLDLKYNFFDQSCWSLYAGGGVSPAVFIGASTVIDYGSTKNVDTQAVGYDRFNFVGDLRAGFDYRLSFNIKLTGGVFYRQFLNATNSNLPTKEYLNSGGLTLGVIYIRNKNKKK